MDGDVDVLVISVFSMERPFTWDDVRKKVEFAAAVGNEQARKMHDLEIDLYLLRLVRAGLLKQHGPRFTFVSNHPFLRPRA
jgi:hypothetical protein